MALLAIQAASGAFARGFAGHPDEAAHFVSALMVADFLSSGSWMDPWSFAKTYYLHYPKVAIGHWPPLLYAMSGAIMAMTGEMSRATVMALNAFAAAVTLTLVATHAATRLGWALGAAAVAILLTSPLFLELLVIVMTEHVVTMFMLASTLAFARFVRTPTAGWSLLFGVLASAAIMVRGSGWALAAVPPLTVLILWRWDLVLRPQLWLSALVVSVICIPWYVFAARLNQNAFVNPSGDPAFMADALATFPAFVLADLGWPVIGLAGVGLVFTLVAPLVRRERVDPLWPAILAMALGLFALQTVSGASIEGRFMVTLLPVVVLFAVAGLGGLLRSVPFGRPALNGFIATAGAALLIGQAALRAQLPVRTDNSDLRPLAAAIDRKTGSGHHVWLLISGSANEGNLITGIALTEPRPGSLVLRGSKLLVEQDWMGRGTRARYANAAELRGLIDAAGVSVVVLDPTIPTRERFAYQRDIRAALTADRNWTKLTDWPLRTGILKSSGALEIFVHRSRAYEKREAADLARIQSLLGGEGLLR